MFHLFYSPLSAKVHWIENDILAKDINHGTVQSHRNPDTCIIWCVPIYQAKPTAVFVKSN